MGIFKRPPQLPAAELDELADASARAADGMRHGPDSSPYREIDADRMDRQAANLRRRAARAQKKEA